MADDLVIIDHKTPFIRIDLLCFSVRTISCLSKLRVVTIFDLISLKDTQFASMPPCTRHVLVEIDQQLSKINLKRGMEPSQIVSEMLYTFGG